MSEIKIKAGLDTSFFKAGLDTMRSEARRFKDTFTEGVGKGGGFLGSIDKAVGKLSTGALAKPFAAIGAALMVARAATSFMEKSWENIAFQTELSKKNIEAVNQLQEQVYSQKHQSGTAANTGIDLQSRFARNDVGEKEIIARSAPNPAAGKGLFEGVLSSYLAAKSLGTNSPMTLFNTAKLFAGRFIPGGTPAFNEINERYQGAQTDLQNAKLKSKSIQALSPFEKFQNSIGQYNAETNVKSAQDQNLVRRGSMRDYEAAEREVFRSDTRYRAIKIQYGETDPRALAAKADVFSAVGTYDQTMLSRGRFRNDPMISADSLARLGGGGGVNVFGDGKGELLFEAKRQTQSLQNILGVLREYKSFFTKGGDIE